MPYPVALVAGLALSAAGTGMQMAGASRARREMQGAQDAEAARQRRYDEQAQATYAQSLAKSDRGTAEAETATGAQRRERAYANVAAHQAAGGLAQPQVTRTGTAGAAAARTGATVRSAGNAWSRLVGGAQARLGGADDWGLQQQIRNRRASEDLAITGSNARRSAGLLGNEMQVARHAGDGLRAWGQLTSALGSLAGASAAVTPQAAAQNRAMAGAVDVPDWRVEEVAGMV